MYLQIIHPASSLVMKKNVTSPTISESSEDFISWSALFGTPPTRKRHRILAFPKTNSGTGDDIPVKKLRLDSCTVYNTSPTIPCSGQVKRIAKGLSVHSNNQSIANVRRSLEAEFDAVATLQKSAKQI